MHRQVFVVVLAVRHAWPATPKTLFWLFSTCALDVELFVRPTLALGNARQLLVLTSSLCRELQQLWHHRGRTGWRTVLLALFNAPSISILAEESSGPSVQELRPDCESLQTALRVAADPTPGTRACAMLNSLIVMIALSFFPCATAQTELFVCE